MKESKLWRLDKRDFLKGLFVAVAGVVVGTLLSIVEAKGLRFAMSDLEQVGKVATMAMLSYLSYSLASDENDKILGKM